MQDIPLKVCSLQTKSAYASVVIGFHYISEQFLRTMNKILFIFFPRCSCSSNVTKLFTMVELTLEFWNPSKSNVLIQFIHHRNQNVPLLQRLRTYCCLLWYSYGRDCLVFILEAMSSLWGTNWIFLYNARTFPSSKGQWQSYGTVSKMYPIPVAVLSKALVCGHSVAGIAGSILAVGMDVCFLWMGVLSRRVLCDRPIAWPEKS